MKRYGVGWNDILMIGGERTNIYNHAQGETRTRDPTVQYHYSTTVLVISATGPTGLIFVLASIL